MCAPKHVTGNNLVLHKGLDLGHGRCGTPEGMGHLRWGPETHRGVGHLEVVSYQGCRTPEVSECSGVWHTKGNTLKWVIM